MPIFLSCLAAVMPMSSGLLVRPAFGTHAGVPASRASVKMIWHVFPRDGAASMLLTDYYVERGMSQTLGRFDMVEYDGQKMHVAPDQCVVVAAEDGSCIYVYAQGNQPTGWGTSPFEQWNWLQPGESVALQNGHKVSLDCQDPEAAVFKFQKASAAGAQQSFAQQGTSSLPPGWISGIDQASGQTYYYNEQSGQSRM